jgi:NAD-dependent deacetylase
MQVYPAASLIYYAPQSIPIFVIDPNETSVNLSDNITFLKMGASKGVKHLKELLSAHV